MLICLPVVHYCDSSAAPFKSNPVLHGDLCVSPKGRRLLQVYAPYALFVIVFSVLWSFGSSFLPGSSVLDCNIELV